MRTSKIVMIGVALCVVLGLISLTMGTAPKPQDRHERLVIGMMQFPSNFHPAIDSMLAKQYVLGFVLRPIAAYDADWQKICILCTEYPDFENGRVRRESYKDEAGQEQNGLAVHITLQDNIFWGDGTAVEAADIEFAWQVGRHPLAGFSNSALYQEDIRDIKVIDAHNLWIYFSKDQCDISSIGDLTLLPRHIETDLFSPDPANYKNMTAYDTDTTNRGLYNGPYIISHIRQGSQITLSRNPYWQGQSPEFEKIELRLFENSAALAANLLSGDIDYIAGELGIPVDQVIGLEKRLNDRFSVLYKPGLFYEHIDLSRRHPALQNKQVRQALLYGIDREEINQTLFGGKMTIARSNINPLDQIYDDTVMDYVFDPERAEKLLDEAGFPRNEGGRRDIHLRLMSTAGNKSRELIQQALQSYWRQLGIDVEIRNHPARTLFGEILGRMNFDSMALYAWISSPQSVPKTTLHSTMIPTEENGWSGQNYIEYRNPRMDALINDLETVCSEPERQALWNEIQHIYAKDLPALPLFHRSEAYLIPHWLTGLRPTGHRFPSSLWVSEWGINEP